MNKIFLIVICSLVLSVGSGCKRNGGDDSRAVLKEPVMKEEQQVTGNPGVDGITHIVAPGESLSKIKDIYGISIAALKKYNNISENHSLKTGASIFVPGSPTVLNARFENYSMGAKSKAGAARAKSQKFNWPVKGQVVSKFSPESKGIFIKAAPNSAVKSISAGEVVFAGQMKGYGNLIIVDHLDGMFSIYGNNKKNLVKKGDNVKEAQKLAVSDDKKSARVYFEIRSLNQDKGEPESVDPMKYMKDVDE
jgi:murein DD-endopeptidase MepM/ murein hydrolase activator NlpD